MIKKIVACLFTFVFLTVYTAAGETGDRQNNISDLARPGGVKLFADSPDMTERYTPAPKSGAYSTAQAFAPVRQILGYYTTQQDTWHYTANGRQIAYGGYFNAGCDYVYIDWSHYFVAGSTPLWFIEGALFDWSVGDWDYGTGPVQIINDPNSHSGQMAVDPKNGDPIAAYYNNPGGGSNTYSMVGYGLCGDYWYWVNEQLPAPPNLEGIHTGYCNDMDASTSPYIWPHHDVDTNSAGQEVVHVAAMEKPDESCINPDPNAIETASFLHYRKVGTGSWEGPFFIDSGYIMSQLVVADRNSSNVYYCYPKPIYYQYGPDPHPCDAGMNTLGYYEITNDIAYRMSTDDGISWGPVVKVTDYAEGFEQGLTDPAAYDLTALVDPDGVLHMAWWSNDWFKSSSDADICGPHSGYYFAGKLWHYDTGNDCISIAYDASHPHYFANTDGVNPFGKYRTACTKPNISWCDDKLYITFERYGAHPVDDTSFEVGAGSAGQDALYQVADILVVGSDATGNMGQTWTSAINLTDTQSDDCVPGDCYSEVWPTMSMFSTDSLMINYLEDKDPGQAYEWGEGTFTENPVMFMTWPCFSMAEIGYYACLSVDPIDPVYAEIALAPNGNTAGCTTPATYSNEIILTNCGNADMGYTASTDAAWLTIVSGSSGNINPGTGPSNADSPGWNGVPGCASPATITWEAYSAPLSEGNYTGTITIDISDPGVDDLTYEVNLVVTCDYYLPEYATIYSGCWTVDLWSTPQAGNQGNNNGVGDMKFYSCGDTISPLTKEAMIIGWTVGSDIYCYTDYSSDHMGDLLPPGMPPYQRQNARFRALSIIEVDSVGNPQAGSGYTHTTGYWCTPDSVVFGKTEYFVPGHQDTSVLIEKISVWNESGTALNNFLVGEGIDWDLRRDSNKDQSGFDISRSMIYQHGSMMDEIIYAGLSPYNGQDPNYGAATLDNTTWVYPDTGYNIIDIYNFLTTLDGILMISDSTLTDLNSVFRFYEGSLAPGASDTLVFCKIKAVSLDGLANLQALIDKGAYFIEDYDLCGELVQCQGRCGNTNGDAAVNVSDAVILINYIIANGYEPVPVKACGDVNGDGTVDMSDAVWLLQFIICGGQAPGDCSPGSWSDSGGDCCAYDAVSAVSEDNSDFIKKTSDKIAQVMNTALFPAISVSDVQVTSSSSGPVSVGVPVTIDGDMELYGASLGFYYDVGDVEIDSISWEGSILESVTVSSEISTDANLAAFTFSGFTYSGYFCDGIPATQGLLATLWFTVETNAPPQTIPIDSGFFPPAGPFVLTLADGQSHAPGFEPGSITVVGGGPQDSIVTDPVFLISPGGHVPFRVYMYDDLAEPIVGDSTVYVMFEYCDSLIRCPDANPSNTIYPEAPSDEEGIVSFYLDGGNCDMNCSAHVMRGPLTIATVPVRMFDISGDLKVSYDSDYDQSPCNDYTGDGTTNTEDEILWAAHLGDSCQMSPCDRFVASFRTIPEHNVVPGQEITLELALANNNEDSCYVGIVSFFLSGFGDDPSPDLFGAVPYNDYLGGGEKDTILYTDVVSEEGSGKILAKFSTDCCPDQIELERNIVSDSICVLDVNECFSFILLLYNPPVHHIESTITTPNDDWTVYFTHTPTFPLYQWDSVTYNICTPNSMETEQTASVVIKVFTDENDPEPDWYESYVSTPDLRGNANYDCFLNVSDAVWLINYVFVNGADPNPCVQGDPNCDGRVNVSDAVYLINFIFVNGPPPCKVSGGPIPTCNKTTGIGKWYK